jgi:hypothetical protein
VYHEPRSVRAQRIRSGPQADCGKLLRSRDGVVTTDFGTREFATLDLDGDVLAFFCWQD